MATITGVQNVMSFLAYDCMWKSVSQFFHHKIFLSPVLWQLNGSNLALALRKQLLEWLTQPWEERVRTVFADSDLSNLLGATNWGAHKQCRPVAENASEIWLADTGLRLQFPHRHKQWQYQFPAFSLLTGASNMCVGRGKPSLCSAGPRLSKLISEAFSLPQSNSRYTRILNSEQLRNHWGFSEQKIQHDEQKLRPTFVPYFDVFFWVKRFHE